MDYDFVVVGGSVAGMAVVAAIEAAAPEAGLLLIEKDREFPYDRPPLSKQLLTGAYEESAALLRSAEEWESSSSSLRTGCTVTGVGSDRVVALDSGESVQAAAVVLAPGCVPRTLDILDGASNALTLRNLADLRRLRRRLTPSSRVVLVGGGFIGLEVASSLLGRVQSVTIIEIDSRPLQRLVGEQAAKWILERPVTAGVDIRTSCAIVETMRDATGAVTGLLLSDGCQVPADVIITGVGVVPAIGWLDDEVVDLGDGIGADANLHTKTPGIFAAGDAVEFNDLRIGRRMRVEHWTTAKEQGRWAGRNAVSWRNGRPLEPFLHVPYVWSDQFGIKIQMAGYAGHASEVHTRVSTPTHLFIEYYEGSSLCAVLGVNAPREVMAARRMLAQQPIRSSETIQ